MSSMVTLNILRSDRRSILKVLVEKWSFTFCQAKLNAKPSYNQNLEKGMGVWARHLRISLGGLGIGQVSFLIRAS